ncbi:MAG: PAS domain S-box protein [Bryobacterales bacterium]|nr:PAS domain S-box protein [Bryobacterales bacterium]
MGRLAAPATQEELHGGPATEFRHALTVYGSVTQALLSAAFPEDGARRALAEIAQAYGWDVGVVWVWEGRWTASGSSASDLTAKILWSRNPVRWMDFEVLTRGAGLCLETHVPAIEAFRRARAPALVECGLEPAALAPLVDSEGHAGFVEFLGPASREESPAREVVIRDFGVILGWFGERCARRAAVEAEASLLRSLFENAPVGLYRSAPDGRILLANPALLEMLGFAALDEESRRVMESRRLDHFACRDGFRQLLDGTGTARGLETQWLRHDGHLLDCLESLRAVRDSSGRVISYDGAVEDISSRKQIELELLSHTQQLEDARARLEEQSIELSATRDRALEASRLKSAFLSSISHEIRTPLNGIIGMTDLALGTELSAEQEEYLRAVRVAAGSLLDLFNDIIELARLGAGDQEPDVTAFEPRLWIEEILKPFARRAEANAVAFSVVFAPDLPAEIEADLERIRKILSCLADNAVKFTSSGSITVTVRPVREGRHLRRLGVSVHDTGAGIPQDRQLAVFEPFIKGDASRSRRFGGTGMGLAIASQLVKLLGGELTMESVPGAGSIFSFQVRARTAGASKTDPAEPRHILLTEENDLDRRILSHRLRKLGLDVTAVRNAPEAAEALDLMRLSMVLVSLESADPGALEMIRAIRQRQTGPNPLPVIALVPKANLPQGDLYRAAGANEVRSKPIRTRELSRLVESWAVAS